MDGSSSSAITVVAKQGEGTCGRVHLVDCGGQLLVVRKQFSCEEVTEAEALAMLQGAARHSHHAN